jgi:hypothetical protein
VQTFRSPIGLLSITKFPFSNNRPNPSIEQGELQLTHKSYFVQREGQSPEGPYTKRSIKEELRNGRWSYDVKVCLDGDTNWRKLTDVPALAGLVPGRSIWLKTSAGLCVLSGASNILLLGIIVWLALRDGKVNATEGGEIVLFAAFALAWIVIARGVYQRQLKAYLRARTWICINIAFHILYALTRHPSAFVPLPFEIVALITNYLARRDFNIA